MALALVVATRVFCRENCMPNETLKCLTRKEEGKKKGRERGKEEVRN